MLLAADEDLRLTGVDHEEGGPARALLNDRFACGEAPLLEQARDLLELLLVQVGEERHTLKGLDRRPGHQGPARVTALHCSR